MPPYLYYTSPQSPGWGCLCRQRKHDSHREQHCSGDGVPNRISVTKGGSIPIRTLASFCEFEGDITMPRDRLLHIYIANQSAEQMADIITWSGGNGRLVYRDYVVFMWRQKLKDTASDGSSSLPPHLCRCFSLSEIKAATQNFSQTFIVGVGGFGHVYKGHVDGGVAPVAIKRLKPESSQGAREFKTEIELLSQLRHRHLVSLIGYCTDKNEMILVYDYMARGTLADHLYHTDNPPLSWGTTAPNLHWSSRGLRYFHSDAQALSSS
ncbi:hypothetical protein DVH24_006202 [Malus domestica]|uniref:Protein kinase domain-containing protein n=1 Tax=Malus domestica TaxID=3750 RepID=A0A498KUY1_MALDO|nr:hypothetical protein DVH24_006202 [Malus domestica]